MASIFRRKKKTVSKAYNPTVWVGGAPVVFYNYGQEDFVRKGYAENAEVYSIINKIADTVNIATPYIYVDKDGVKSRNTLTATRKSRDTAIGAGKHRLAVRKALDFADVDLDLSQLLESPNPFQTWKEFITLKNIFYFAQGEAFIYRVAGNDSCAMELYVLPAHLMTPIVDLSKSYLEQDILVGWQLNLLNGKTRNFVGDEMQDLLHFKMPNPLFDDKFIQLRGFSPLMAGLKYLKLDDTSIESWVKSVQNEGAKGLISPNHANPELWLTPEQVEDTQRITDEKIHGADNRNKIVVSGMPLQYTHIGLSPDALNIVNGLEHANFKLCNLWGVPPELFNPDPTYSNQREAGKRLIKEVVLPHLNAEEDKLNNWLVEPFSRRDGKNYVIDYDLSSYEELRITAEEANALLTTHTLNEVRVMQGSDELDNDYANEVFIAQGKVPLSDYNLDITL